QLLGDALSRRHEPRRDQAGLRLQAALLHIFGEAEDAHEALLDGRCGDETAPAALALDETVGDQLSQGLANGGPADVVLLHQAYLSGNGFLGRPLAVDDLVPEQAVYLLVERFVAIGTYPIPV